MAMLESHEHTHAYHDFDGIIEIRANHPPTYFSVLFYGLVIWGTVFCAYFLLSGWSSEAEFREKMAAHQARTEEQQTPKAPKDAAAGAAVPAQEDLVAQGRDLFDQHCAACHGQDATGGIGPDLTAATYRYGKSDEAVTESIATGRPGGMPAFGNQLAGDQVSALVAYIQSL